MIDVYTGDRFTMIYLKVTIDLGVFNINFAGRVGIKPGSEFQR